MLAVVGIDSAVAPTGPAPVVSLVTLAAGVAYRVLPPR